MSNQKKKYTVTCLVKYNVKVETKAEAEAMWEGLVEEDFPDRYEFKCVEAGHVKRME